MKMNVETCLVGEKVVLVPYRKEHVLTYHEWMSDPHLLELTASEPLSLVEEYEMQQSWRNDENKCTFIVLERCQCEGIPEDVLRLEKEYTEPNSAPEGDADLFLVPLSAPQHVVNDQDFVAKNIHAMVGDVNLFLSFMDDDDGVESSHSYQRQQGELNLMIAETSARRKGIGTESCQLAMLYGIQVLGVQRFFVKIGETNLPSITMFERALNFTQCNYVECFREYEHEFLCSGQSSIELLRQWSARTHSGDQRRRPIYFLLSSPTDA